MKSENKIKHYRDWALFVGHRDIASVLSLILEDTPESLLLRFNQMKEEASKDPTAAREKYFRYCPECFELAPPPNEKMIPMPGVNGSNNETPRIIIP